MKKYSKQLRFTLFVFFILFMISNPLSAANDLTDRFRDYQAMDQKEMMARLQRDLKDHYVFLHPGFLAKFYQTFHTGYFGNFSHCLKKLGFKNHQDFDIYQVNGITTLGSMSKKLAKRLKQIPKDKKILLIGHSKGGADLFYLFKQYPELVPENEIAQIASAMLIQTPLKGTPVANWMEDMSPLRLFFTTFLTILGDSFSIIHEGRTDEKNSLYEQFKENMSLSFPVITVGTDVPKNKLPSFWILGPSHHQLGKENNEYSDNDGLTPVNSALIKEQLDYILLHNVDHGQMTMRLPYIYSLASLSNTRPSCSKYVFPFLAILLDTAATVQK